MLNKLPFNKDITLALLKVQKQSPTLLFGAGVVGVVSTVVLASRATLRLSDIVEDTSVTLNQIKTLDREDYSEQDRTKDKAILYTQSSIKIGKLYAPAFFLGAVSIGCLTGSHQILSRRNVALTAAYAGVEKSLQEGVPEYRVTIDRESGEFRQTLERQLQECQLKPDACKPRAQESSISST